MPVYTLPDLLELMRRLRDPETGCSWDIEQSYRSITSSTIEEVYEVVDAIEREDFTHLKEELGDLLFQVVFYAELAKEDQYFDFNDIVHVLTTKLIRRHPHVFPDGTLASVNTDKSNRNDVIQKWDEIKQQERTGKGQKGILEDVPKALPSLQRAQKLQKRVSKAGMDWRSVEDSLVNLESEIAELRVAIHNQNERDIADEVGDVLFSCVNVARKLRLDADHVLRDSNSKFEARIQCLESLLKKQEKSWSDLSDNAFVVLWQQAKSIVG